MMKKSGRLENNWLQECSIAKWATMSTTSPHSLVHRFVVLVAGECSCLELRAAPFGFGLIASQLVLAISFLFGVRTPCCGHGLDCGHSSTDADAKNKAPEQVNYIPFQRFNDPEDTTELENVNDGSFFCYELQASKASHRLAQLSQFSLNNCVGHPLNSDAVDDNPVCLVEGFPEITLKSFGIARLGGFYLPFEAVDQYIWSVDVLPFPPAYKTNLDARRGKSSRRVHLMRPNIGARLDNDSSRKIAHGAPPLSLRDLNSCPLARESLYGVTQCLRWSLGRYKNAGKPPALGGRPLREDQGLYTTGATRPSRNNSCSFKSISFIREQSRRRVA